jgi:hypothetical protein
LRGRLATREERRLHEAVAMRPLLVRVIAALACASAGSVVAVGFASSCSGPERKPELPNPAAPGSPTAVSPPALSPESAPREVRDAPAPVDGGGAVRP